MSATEPTSARQRLRDLRLMRLRAHAEITPIAARRDGNGKPPAIGPIPLTHTQRRVWFLAQLDPSSSAYNEARAHRLNGPLNIDALKDALHRLTERHEILRTTYSMAGHEPVQQLTQDMHFALECVDFSSHSQSAREQELQTALNAASQEPFDLSLGPLMRFRVFRLTDSEHVLLRTWHHIVTDGWSAGVFERELSALYEAQVSGRAVALAPLPIQYADYALWQRQWLAGPLLQQQLSYWRRQLADLSTLALPTDRPRPAMQSDRGAVLAVALPAELAQRLRALARAEGTTLFMAGLAAFKVLLYRYSGTTDVAVGTPIAGRGRTELEGLIGFLANTLVLRTDLSGGPSFRALLARVRECALNAYTHQDLPFERLVEELAPVRDLSRNPLFQVCFALHDAAGPGLTLHGLQVQPIELPARHAKFDLSLDLRERDNTLHASFEYCTDLFEHASIQRMAEHFTVLLTAIVQDPEQCIDTLPLMTFAERQRILVQFNETARPYPKNVSLAALFQAQVQRSPHASALVHDNLTLTYEQLNQQANRLAHHLIDLGVHPEVPVAICMHRSPDLIIAILAILKAGGCYVPLDPDLPIARAEFILKDAGAKLLMTQQSMLQSLPSNVCPVICVDHDGRGLGPDRGDDPPINTEPQHLVYVMYTSGSTGKPKGVAIRQQGVIRLVNQPNYVDIAPGDTIAQISNAAFDASTFEIWGALINGARLVILSRETVLSPTQLARALQSHQVTTMFLTTALFNRVGAEQPTAFSTLRNVLFGGEVCDPDRVKAVMKAGPPARLVHVYGPTETTTFATYHVVREQEDRTTIPIGRPISETQVLLLDSHGQLVAPGVVGEIHIGGLGLAAGYVGRPDETLARFIDHPFEPNSGARLYRTGDHARWLPDGSIEFLGRHDDQVKIRGFRIETAEVTTVLATHPDIRACHVMARRQPNGELGLTAYLVRVPASQGPLSIAQLRGFLSERLPGYMIPASYVALEALPLTINGKIDVQALPDPGAAAPIEGAEPAGPRDSTERTICRVWAEVLGTKSVGLDDNFFELGGHSLLAAKMFARLDEEFGRPLPLGVLFSAPTVRELAERFRDPGAHAAEAARALVPLQSHGTRPALYILPGVFGNVVGYVDLVRALGRDQPVYGLQSIGLNGQAAPLHSMQAIAQHHLAEIRAHQPKGPYAIIGACFGATVAFEISRQLLAQGQHVAYLGLIAPTSREGHQAEATVSRAPRSIQRTAAFGQLLIGRLRTYTLDMRGLDTIGRLRYLTNKLRSLAKGAAGPNAFKGAARELNQLEVYRANIHALDSYRRLPLVGNLTTLDVFESEATMQRGHRDLIDWQVHWQGPICQHMVPGDDSGDMISGHNATLIGSKLAARLQAAFDTSAGRRSG